MTQVANTYAQALYALAKDEGVQDEILQQLDVLHRSVAQEPDYIRLLSAPNLTKAERCAIVDAGLRDSVHPYVLNFMKLLTEKGYMRHFADCCVSYREQYNDDHGILSVQAVTAVALTETQSTKLAEKLGTVTGKTISLTNRVDPAVLGGVRLDYDGKRVDGTVANRLESIRSLLKNTVL